MAKAMPAFKRYRLDKLTQTDTARNVVVQHFLHPSLDLFLDDAVSIFLLVRSLGISYVLS